MGGLAHTFPRPGPQPPGCRGGGDSCGPCTPSHELQLQPTGLPTSWCLSVTQAPQPPPRGVFPCKGSQQELAVGLAENKAFFVRPGTDIRPRTLSWASGSSGASSSLGRMDPRGCPLTGHTGSQAERGSEVCFLSPPGSIKRGCVQAPLPPSPQHLGQFLG